MLVGIRGAITVSENRSEAIQAAAAQLFTEIVESNDLERGNVVTAFFTSTPDLNMAFPATAARILGWSDVPFLGAQELAVSGAIPRCIRVLVLANLDESHVARHVYLEGAAALRPDLVGEESAAPVEQGSRKRVAVVGLGLIGGSISAGLPRDRWEVWGVDSDPATIRSAESADAPERLMTLDELEASESVDVIVLATPIPSIVSTLERWARTNPPRGAVITDVGSTKQGIVDAMTRLPDHSSWIAGHPIAGTEASGFDARNPDLFRGATWALSTESRGDGAAKVVESLVSDLGARALRIDAPKHDRILARTSHLPYLVAGAVAREVAGLEAADILHLV